MEFNLLGFTQSINTYESEYLLGVNFFTTDTSGTASMFNLSQYFMSNRQCAKKMFLKRDPKSKDEDVNKTVYGSDLLRVQEASYVQWLTDNDDVDPTIVKESDSMTDDLDSPFKPLKTQSEIYEQIDTYKREMVNNFFSIQFLLKDLDIQRTRVFDILDNISNYGSKNDLKNAQTSIIVLTLNSLFENAKTICNLMRWKIKESERYFLNFKNLEFIVNPASIEDVMTYLLNLTTNIKAEKINLDTLEAFIEASKTTILDGVDGLVLIDDGLEAASTAFKVGLPAAAAAGPLAGSALVTLQTTYEGSRETILSQRVTYITELVSVVKTLPQINIPTLPTVPDLPIKP